MDKYWLVFDLARKVRLNHFIRTWRRQNRHNDTIPKNIFPESLVSIGKDTYGELNVLTFNNNTKLQIGSYCAIAQEVYFLLDVEHTTKTLSQYPFKAKKLKKGQEAFSKGDIVIDDDVWIGFGTTVLSGVHIGQGAVIAAGSIVTMDVPPYSIVAGTPAKVIKYRFPRETINLLKNFDFGKLKEEQIEENIGALSTAIDDIDPEKIRELFSWFPNAKTGKSIHETEEEK